MVNVTGYWAVVPGVGLAGLGPPTGATMLDAAGPTAAAGEDPAGPGVVSDGAVVPAVAGARGAPGVAEAGTLTGR